MSPDLKVTWCGMKEKASPPCSPPTAVRKPGMKPGGACRPSHGLCNQHWPRLGRGGCSHSQEVPWGHALEQKGLYRSVRLALHQQQGSPDTLLTGGHWPVPRPQMTRSPLLIGGPSLQVEMSFTARGKLIPINFHRLVQLSTLRLHWNKAHHSIIPRLPHIVAGDRYSNAKRQIRKILILPAI